MKLGKAGQIVIGTKVYDKSLDFVKKLNLKSLEEGTSPWDTRFAMFTDGRANYLVDETKQDENYCGLIYFNPDLEKALTKIKAAGFEVTPQEQDGKLMSALIKTNEGIFINILNQDHEGSPDPKNDESIVDFGKFGEFAIHVKDLDKSCEDWEKLGFEVLHKSHEMQYAIAYDGIFIVGLHSHELDKIGLTYFDGKMEEKVKLLKDRGIELEKEEMFEMGEMKGIDARTRSPDGQWFYFFTGEI